LELEASRLGEWAQIVLGVQVRFPVLRTRYVLRALGHNEENFTVLQEQDWRVKDHQPRRRGRDLER
jgi:hypothetical protein